MLFLLLVIFVVFIFEYINGYHDAANAIATVVSTRVLTPRLAVLLAACFNLLGALSGEAVAKTVGAGPRPIQSSVAAASDRYAGIRLL